MGRGSDNLSTEFKREAAAVLKAVAPMVGVGLIAAAAGLAAFAWLAEEVPEGDTKGFDNAVRLFVHGFANDTLTAVMTAFSFVGSMLIISIASAALFSLLIWRKHRHSAYLFLTATIGAGVLNVVLKLVFERARPTPYFDTPLPASYSFPSGHALLSFCFFSSLAWVIAAHKIPVAAKIAVWSAAAVAILGVGISRIYLGVHYPTDVIAGYLAAIVWLSSLFVADVRLAKRGIG